MIILLACCLAVPMAVIATGGSFGRLSQIPFSARWLLVIAVALQQVAIFNLVTPDVATVLHLLTYALAGVWVIANRTVRGLLLAASGGLANFAAIVTNGGTMPATRGAATAAGLTVTDGFVNSSVPADRPPLWWLGDVFAVPAGMPLANVFSVGDVLLVIGVTVIAAIHSQPSSIRPELDDVVTNRDSEASVTPDVTRPADAGGHLPGSRRLTP